MPPVVGLAFNVCLTSTAREAAGFQTTTKYKHTTGLVKAVKRLANLKDQQLQPQFYFVVRIGVASWGGGVGAQGGV